MRLKGEELPSSEVKTYPTSPPTILLTSGPESRRVLRRNRGANCFNLHYMKGVHVTRVKVVDGELGGNTGLRSKITPT